MTATLAGGDNCSGDHEVMCVACVEKSIIAARREAFEAGYRACYAEWAPLDEPLSDVVISNELERAGLKP